jgi:hypothetical protein
VNCILETPQREHRRCDQLIMCRFTIVCLHPTVASPTCALRLCDRRPIHTSSDENNNNNIIGSGWQTSDLSGPIRRELGDGDAGGASPEAAVGGGRLAQPGVTGRGGDPQGAPASRHAARANVACETPRRPSDTGRHVNVCLPRPLSPLDHVW